MNNEFTSGCTRSRHQVRHEMAVVGESSVLANDVSKQQQKLPPRLTVKDLMTGDLLLFSGSGLTSEMVKVFTGSKQSHAAVVWVCPITSVKYLFESGSVDKTNFLPIVARRNASLNAAHLIPLDIKLCQKHNKQIHVKRLWLAGGEGRSRRRIAIDSDLQVAFDIFVARHLGMPYTTNLVGLWLQRGNPLLVDLPFLEEEQDEDDGLQRNTTSSSLAAQVIIDGRAEDKEGDGRAEWMCSQLVIHAYWKLGIIPKPHDADSSAITPGDLMEDIVTLPGYEFEEPVLLVDRNNK